MRKISVSAIVLASLVFVYSCNDNEVSNKIITADTIQFETKDYDIADKSQQSDPALQSHYQLSYPEITDDIPKAALENINAYFAGFILDSETPVKEFPNINKQAQKLFHEYEEVYKEFPRTSTWIVDKKIEIVSKTGPLLTISFSESSYKGGAHPNSNTFYKIFDLNTGKLVNIYEIIDSAQTDKLNAIRLETLNKQKNSLMPEGDWKTYMFPDAFEPNGTFNTNSNMKASKDTIEFYYNSYDIAAYAFGPTAIKIPVSELKPLLLKSSPYYSYF